MKATVNWFYVLIALMFFGMLYISARFFKGSGNSSIGIAKALEYRIKAEKSSLVKTVHVGPGRQVKAGDILVELTNQDLEIDIDKLSSRIAVLKSEQFEKSKLVEAEIAYERAQNGITEEEIETKIQEIQSNSTLNRDLTREFIKATGEDTVAAVGPQQTKLRSLQQQKVQHVKAMDIKIQDIRQKKNTEQNLLVNQIRLLERELELMKEEKQKLNKYAATDGVVDHVFVKDGEQVSAYAPLLSVNPIRPATVVGYLVGKKFSIPAIGSTVSVASYDRRLSAVTGKVVGYGSVSELPEILQKSTAVKAFGRELFIEISPDNNFANGEKVLIR